MNNRKDILDLTKSIELITIVQELDKGIILCDDFEGERIIELFEVDKNLCCTIMNEHTLVRDKMYFQDVKFRGNDLSLDIPYIILSGSTFDKRNGDEIITSKGRIPSFKYKSFHKNKTSFNRLILPLSESVNFMFSVENIEINYKYATEITTVCATKVCIDQKNFYLYEITDALENRSSNRFLVIDYSELATFNEFSEYCSSILICFGYISGSFVNDNGYYFQYANSEMIDPTGFFYTKMRSSVNCDFVPVYSNPNGYIHDTEKALPYQDKLRKLTIDEFSKLCLTCCKFDSIKTVLLLLIEVNSQSLIAAPATLSIVLETLANFVYVENEDKLIPIKNKTIARQLRKDLLRVLDNFEIDTEGKSIIINKINQINQITNKSRLLAPFKILKIPLYAADIDAIEQRNAFLHGKIPEVQNKVSSSIQEEDKFRYYLYLKLHVLISSILMKYIGYDSLVVNYPKIYESSTGIYLEEELYRQI